MRALLAMAAICVLLMGCVTPQEPPEDYTGDWWPENNPEEVPGVEHERAR